MKEREKERNTLPKVMFLLEVQREEYTNVVSPSPCTDYYPDCCWCDVDVTNFFINTRVTIGCWRSTLWSITFGLFTSCRYFRHLHLESGLHTSCRWYSTFTLAVQKHEIGCSPFLPLWVPATDSKVTWLEVARMIHRHFADDKKHRSLDALYWGSIHDSCVGSLAGNFFVSRLTFLKVCQLHNMYKSNLSCAWSSVDRYSDATLAFLRLMIIAKL